MIGKLKRKTICINMVFVTFVLVMAFVVVCASTQRSMEKDSRNSLLNALNKPYIDQDLPFIGRGGRDKAPDVNSPVITLLIDENGGLLLTSESEIFFLSSEAKDAIIQSVISTQYAQCEVLPEYSLRYMTRNVSEGIKIAVSDISRELTTMKELIYTCAFLGVSALLAFFFISLLLANISMRPLKKAWLQQRQFIADASHELKTPLTVILANTDILLNDNGTQTPCDHKKWLENTKAEAIRMKELVNDMLYLAKSDDHQIESEFSEFDLSDLVNSEILTFECVYFEKGLSLSDYITSNIVITGDEKKIRQLVGILIDNSIKYSRAGENIRVILKKEQGKAYFSIRNFGDVIAQEDIDHIFDRFYRSDKSRARAGGFGLGLSIAKSISDVHGGKIFVKSDAKCGTEFTVILPQRAKKRNSEA